MDGKLWMSSRNGEVYCTFHKSSVGQGMRWSRLTHAETKEWTALVSGEGHGSPCEACDAGFGGTRPNGPITNAEAVFA